MASIEVNSTPAGIRDRTYNLLESQLIEAIKNSLSYELYSNAAFLAERLYAEMPNESAKLLLAESYLGENKIHKAYYILKASIVPLNRYKFAMICIKLQKYSEAEKALIGHSGEGDEVAGGAAGYYLLGIISQKQGKQKQALEFFTKAIELDPTLWIAFEKICKLGSNISPASIFSDSHITQNKTKEYSIKYTPNPIENDLIKTPLQKEATRINRNYEIQPAIIDISPIPFHNENKELHSRIMIQTPQHPIYGFTPGMLNKITMQAPQKDRNGVYASNSSVKGMVSLEELKTSNEPAVNPFLISSSKSNGELDSSPIVNAELSSTHKSAEAKFQTSPYLSSKSTSNSKNILSLLRQIGIAYYALIKYKCSDAIAMFKELPKNHYNTGWVLSNIARALFESVRYNEAAKLYNEIIKLEPYRLEGLEYYSTCLWHLKKQVDLCKLSNYMLGVSLYAPETWCVVGNTFSMQKEHETALKFFQRAIQLNPSFAYAHTLSGHEYASNEDFDSAKNCYQKALSLDDKQYNAWWGIGNICLRREQYDNAIQYFKYAMKIHSYSSILPTYLGMTYSRNKQPNKALEYFDLADKLDPGNPLNRYQKASALISLNQLEQALIILEELNVKVPRESPIHMLIARVYKKLGNIDKALHHYTTAMDLEPKEANRIRSLIDKLNRKTQDSLPDEI